MHVCTSVVGVLTQACSWQQTQVPGLQQLLTTPS